MAMFPASAPDQAGQVANPSALQLRSPAGSVIAIDIGGTKVECGVVAGDGQVIFRRRVLTGGGTEEDLFELVASTAERVRDEAANLAGATTPIMCGVGCGGPMDMRVETVSPLNIAQWNDFALRYRLEARLGLPTYVDNDAKALTLAEGWIGA
ncbi:MAG: ROK family protein, partial [Actinobacteria bacterium]|nr:ROK family protein [Actinomycetota bacterium]